MRQHPWASDSPFSICLFVLSLLKRAKKCSGKNSNFEALLKFFLPPSSSFLYTMGSTLMLKLRIKEGSGATFKAFLLSNIKKSFVSFPQTQHQAFLDLCNYFVAFALDLTDTSEAAAAHYISSYVLWHHPTPDDLHWWSKGVFQALGSWMEIDGRWMGFLTLPLAIVGSPACFPTGASEVAAGVSKHRVGSPAAHQLDNRGVLPKPAITTVHWGWSHLCRHTAASVIGGCL